MLSLDNLMTTKTIHLDQVVDSNLSVVNREKHPIFVQYDLVTALGFFVVNNCKPVFRFKI